MGRTVLAPNKESTKMARKNKVTEIIDETQGETLPEAVVVAEAAAPEVTLTVELGFTEANRTLKAHDCEVDVSSITPAGLHYLLVLGFTTSLTQCNAGVATAAREMGKTKDEIDAELSANRQERLQKICAGTIGSRTAGPKVSADDKLLRDFAWAAITRQYAKAGKPLPKGKGEKNAEIDVFLAGPAGDAVRKQVEAFTVDLDV